MNKRMEVSDSLGWECEEGEVVALVRQGLGTMDGPAPATLRAIAAEARQVADRHRFQRGGRRWQHRLGAAASFAIIVTTALLVVRSGSRLMGYGRVEADSERAELASLLLDIQGLNEEGFFMVEEGESLWL